ncbi:MAG: VCBS repeat-containing protein, partial [Candidatus Eisenbacteria bacterium]|nr:VCBS repeat-containing protein [Candidatus Eisenbacteria bacterium]
FHNWLNVSGPALADLDGDGDLDVGAAAELGIYFFDGSGRPLEGWPYLWIAPQQNIQWSCPSIADIDGDGLLEIACANNSLYYESVHVVDCFAQPEPGWPTYDIEPVFASTALADLDGDGDYEVIAKDGENTWIGHRLYVWHHDGTPMAGFPMSICEDWVSSRSNPSVGDVQGDGVLEIVTATCDGNVHVIRPDAHELPGWPKALTPNGSISTPALADVDADGQQEIFLCYWQDYSQYVGGWNLDGTVVPGFPKLLLAGTEWDAHGSPHVADFDHDGRFEVAACGTNWTSGNVCVFPIEGSVYTPGVTVCEWPKIRRDLAATGTYPALDPAGIGDPAVFAAGSFAVWPNPAGPSVVELRYAARGLASPAAGLLRAFDPLGRAVGAVQVGAAGTIAIRDLFGGDGSPASGIYWLRWEPRSGAPRSTRWIRLAD